MGNQDPNSDEDYDWGVIYVKTQLDDKETPMMPITIMRNGLGRDQGGSGVPIDKEKYLESVEFWSKNISVFDRE